jgi:hypothetical protein
MIYLRLMLLAAILVVSSLSISLAADKVENLSEIPTYIPENGQIHATQTILLNTTIGTNSSSLLFVLNWLNATSNLEATLISPSGVKIDSTTQSPVIYGENTSLIFYILPNPEVGKWTAMITAKDVLDMGESYWALFSTTPEDNSTKQVLVDEKMNLSDLDNISEACENCIEES